MDSPDRMYQQQNSKIVLLVTIRAPIYLAYDSDHGVLFRVAIAITNVHTIKNANVIDVPLPDREPRIILPLPTQNTLPPNFTLRGTGMPDRHSGVNLRNQSWSRYFADRIPNQPFRCVLLISRLVPSLVLKTQVLVSNRLPLIAVVIV